MDIEAISATLANLDLTWDPVYNYACQSKLDLGPSI